MGQRWLDGYSAAVEIYLLVNGQRHDIAQIGAGSFILREPVQLPPATEAKLVLIIDGHEEVENVLLTQGASSREEPVSFF